MALRTHKINVTIYQNGQTLTPAVDAYLVGLLAVHRNFGTPKNGWTITHTPTGRSIGPSFTSRNTALYSAQLIEPICDWANVPTAPKPRLALLKQIEALLPTPTTPARDFTKEATPIIVRVYNPTYSKQFADCGDVLILFPTEVADYHGAAINTLDIWLNRTTFVSHSNGTASFYVMMDRKRTKPAPQEIVEQAIKWLTEHYPTEAAPHGFKPYRRDQKAFRQERYRQAAENRNPTPSPVPTTTPIISTAKEPYVCHFRLSRTDPRPTPQD